MKFDKIGARTFQDEHFADTTFYQKKDRFCLSIIVLKLDVRSFH